jgi:hypothetical protein
MPIKAIVLSMVLFPSSVLLVRILDDTIRPSFENEAVTIYHCYAVSGLVWEWGRHYVQRKGLTEGKGPELTDGEGAVDPPETGPWPQ